MSTVATSGTTPYHANTRAPVYAAQARPVASAAQPQRDDHERWYAEERPNNRMLLSLRSGIDQEVRWAIDRLCRLSNNDKFNLKAYLGLTDALLEWPERFVSEYDESAAELADLFVVTPEQDRVYRNALESLFILRNAAVHEPNAIELASHPRVRLLLVQTLQKIKPNSDANVEYLTHIIQILQSISTIPSTEPISSHPAGNPVPALLDNLRRTSHRTLIITCLETLDLILANHANTSQIRSDSPALQVAIRCLALFIDKPLLNASLNYLYTHLSYPPMLKAFMHHRDMPSVLRLLVNLLVSEQVEETVTHTIGEPAHTVPAHVASTKLHVMTDAEYTDILPKPEPERCYEWMRIMFIATPDGEMTQVDFWNLYKDTFIAHAEQYPLLVASDVIKNVNVVFPQAQAMVLPGPPQRFVVRGVARQMDDHDERFKCMWERGQCSAEIFTSPGDLYEHLLGHIATLDDPAPCLWATCTMSCPRSVVHTHALTHLQSAQPAPRHPLQGDRISLPSRETPYPMTDPTSRPVPSTQVTLSYRRPMGDPPSSSLTALLCIRLLYHASFASKEAAPRLDADHFGFPGIVEEEDIESGPRNTVVNEREELEGEARGKRAFASVRRLLEQVQLRDESMMGWIHEMTDTDAAIPSV